MRKPEYWCKVGTHPVRNSKELVVRDKKNNRYGICEDCVKRRLGVKDLSGGIGGYWGDGTQ